MEYLNMERVHYEFQETVGLWTRAKLESHSAPCSSSVQLDFTDPLLGELYEWVQTVWMSEAMGEWMSECESEPLSVNIHIVYPSVRTAIYFLGIHC